MSSTLEECLQRGSEAKAASTKDLISLGYLSHTLQMRYQKIDAESQPVQDFYKMKYNSLHILDGKKNRLNLINNSEKIIQYNLRLRHLHAKAKEQGRMLTL